MTLSDFSIKRPVFAWILMFGLIFFGLISFQNMGVNENPDVDFPTITINYSYDGATPAVIEKDVLEPVESVIVSMEGIRNLTSIADRGNGAITVEFELNRNIDFALQEAQTLLGRAQRELPDSVDPPVVTKSNAADEPVMYAALSTTTLSQRELMLLFRDRIRDQLSTIEGVAEIRAFGYHEPILRVDLISKKLRAYDLTAADVVTSIQREHQELPAGKFEFEDREDLIRIMGEIEDPAKFGDIVISRRGGSPNYQPIRLKDVATVSEGIENTRRISRINGEPSLAMAVQKQRGVNAVATADRIIKKLKTVNESLPEGTKLSVNYDRTQFVRESVNELLFTLILSALLTSLVCWVFIGSITATFNILLAIPTAVIGTFIFMEWMGFTLNTFSILGLALAIGIVVDDAIVMLENIIRYVQQGISRVNAAFKGAREISFAVIATSIALIALFIPVGFMPGIEGRFFFEFAVTISIAVALSSLEALTLAPMRCSQFLRLTSRGKMGQKFEASLMGLASLYEKVLGWSLHRRMVVIVCSFLIFGASLFLVRLIPTEFAPDQDRGALFTIFVAPDGKSMQYTDQKVREFEKIVGEHPDVERVTTAVGGFGRGGQGNKGNGFIILKPLGVRKKTQFQVAEELRANLKQIEGINFFIRDRTGSAIGGRRGSPVEFTISGPDPEMQKQLFAEFKKRMDADPEIVGTRSDDVSTLPEIHLVPNRRKALARGVEVGEVAQIVNATFGGVVAGQYTKGGSRFDIFVQLQEENRRKPEDISSILVRNNRGQTLSLGSVVDVESTQGPQVIYREDRIRGVRVDASLAAGAKVGPVIKKLRNWSTEILPPEYFIRFSATPEEKLMDTMFIIFLGLIIAYMVLACQFNSFMDPLLIFLAIPFGMTGSILALMLGGQTLNVYSLIGILLTMGIVKKNSILLVEFTNQLRDEGRSIRDSLMHACTIRLRPILMTNLSTLAAAIPPALAIGPGNETRIPMALTIIGGILVSVCFTLIVVPCAYDLIQPKRRQVLEEKSETPHSQAA